MDSATCKLVVHLFTQLKFHYRRISQPKKKKKSIIDMVLNK